MAQSTTISTFQFFARIIVALRDLFKRKKPEGVKRKAEEEKPVYGWVFDEEGFVSFRGKATKLKPVLAIYRQPAQTDSAGQGTKFYSTWREVVSPKFFDDIKAYVEEIQRQGGGK